MTNTKDQDSSDISSSNIEYAHTELFPHDLLTYDDVAAIYVIDTEFLRDSFNAGLANLHLDTIIGKDSTIYYTYTNYIFCAIVEISLCTIANSGNDVQYVTEMVLEEQYDNGVSIRETVSTSDDIDGTSVISQLVTPIYGGLVKYLISFSSEIKHSNLVPIHWSYPNYQYLSIGELYDY